MILFCEDCGEKNDLDPAAFAGGKAVFHCSVCGYPNAYSINLTERFSHDESTGLFEAIESFPGFIGGFLYHGKQGVVRHKMPTILTQGDIDTLGVGLVKSFAEGRIFCPDLMKMTVMISDKFFSVFKVGTLLYTVVITMDPSLPEKVLERLAGLEKKDW